MRPWSSIWDMAETNRRLRLVASRALKSSIQLFARSAGKRFYCNLLSGESSYNLVINSDMSVSCNCQDYDGSGRLGDLSSANLYEVFNGPAAMRFRKTLADGELPVLTCARCAELRYVDKDSAHPYVRAFEVPRKGIMVENTVLCNLNCVGCYRDSVMHGRKKKKLTAQDVKKVSLSIKEHKIERLSYFNLGEPFLSPDIFDELQVIREDNPGLEIIVSTNGLRIDNQRQLDAALLLDQIVFSIDGVSTDVLRKYQRNGDFEKAYENMSKLVEYRNSKGTDSPAIEWKYVLFNWNDRKECISKAIELAGKAGVDIISFWPTLNPFYGVSWRYYTGGYVKRVGRQSWKGRELVLNEIGQDRKAQSAPVTLE